MLKFNAAWRFKTPASVPDAVVNECFALIEVSATQGDRKEILELFKRYFARAAGASASWSSTTSWAETDLQAYMKEAAANAPLFIEAFYDACEALRGRDADFFAPDAKMINAILSKHDAGFEVQPPNLIASHTPVAPIPVPTEPPSLDERAREIIQSSLHQSEQLLSEGLCRQAVQELLWLLETVSTAFRGLETGAGTVQGKYFNKIVNDLRRHNRGNTLEQILDWITTLHGYLSSPTGGGIRHGADLKTDIAMQPNEARLFCNLIRSYISFLMTEHERLTRTP